MSEQAEAAQLAQIYAGSIIHALAAREAIALTDSVVLLFTRSAGASAKIATSSRKAVGVALAIAGKADSVFDLPAPEGCFYLLARESDAARSVLRVCSFEQVFEWFRSNSERTEEALS